MAQQLHSQARTTQKIRDEIRNSNLSIAELARRYNITRPTVRKWKERESVEDLSHRPHNLSTTLSPEQELIVVEIRRLLKLSTDDLFVVTREFINPKVSRAGIIRMMKRHGVNDLAALEPQTEEPKKQSKSFKDYESGFIHVDIKYLPCMPDEKEGRHYLYVAIDRATRWGFIMLKEWHKKRPDLFLKNVYNHAGLDAWPQPENVALP